MQVKKGDLIIIDLASFVDRYSVLHDPDWIALILSNHLILGLVTSDSFHEESLLVYDKEWMSERIYPKKMYNVYICGKIIPIYASDIGEKL
jgi:hypothetical protein